MDDITVIKPGSTVVVDNHQEAIVISVVVGINGILYECGWWVGADYKTEHFYQFQVKTIETKRQRIGF